VGFSPAIDNTIQFSELPDVQVCISAVADRNWLSISSKWPLVLATPSPCKKLYQWKTLIITNSTPHREWSWKNHIRVYISLLV